MPNAIGSLMPRRGRRSTHESEFDSIWGDVKITSPTDSVPLWQPHDPKLEAYLAQVNGMAWAEDVSTVKLNHLPRYRSSSQTATASNTTQRVEANLTLNGAIDATVTHPRLTIRTGRSQSQPRWQAPASIVTPPAHAVSAVDNRQQQQPSQFIQSTEDYFEYVKAPYPNAARSGVMSPPLSDTSEALNQRSKTGLFHANRSEDGKGETVQHIISGDNKKSNLSHGNTPVVDASKDGRHANRESPSSRPTSIRIESFYSPLVTILSPVSETSAAYDVERLRDEIIVLENEIKHLEKKAPTSLRSSIDEPVVKHEDAHLNANSLSDVDSTCNPQLMLHGKGAGLQNTMAFSSHPVQRSRAAPTLVEGIGIFFGSGNDLLASPPPLSAVTAVTDLDDSESLIFPTQGRATSSDQLGSGAHESKLSISGNRTFPAPASAKSPPLGVTGAMRAPIPPLGVTQAMRKYSPRIGMIPDDASRTQNDSSRRRDRPKPASLAPQSLHAGSRHRSASMEALASPSFFNSPSPSTSRSTFSVTTPPYTETVGSDASESKCTCKCPVHGSDGNPRPNPMVEAARYGRRISHDDRTKIHRRAHSYATVNSQDMSRTSAELPWSTVAVGMEETPKGLYNEVRSDFRQLAHEKFASGELDLVIQEQEEELRRKQHRDRSISRPRNTSSEHGNSSLDETEMVPSYSQVWL